MNGSGIQPTVELATTNGNNGFAYPYPVYPAMGGFGGGYGNGGFLGGDGWIILLLLLAFSGNWGNGGNGGFFGGNSFDNGYAWLSNGQKEIMQNTNNGFDTLHLSNQLDTINGGIYSLSNQLCNTGNDITNAISNGFYNSEISANNRQMADMNQMFNLQSQLANCCCENRLATANLGSDIAREACATRTTDTQNTQSLLTAITGGIQSIKDQLCSDKIDAKNDEIAQLRQELLYARGQASQVQQTAEIRLGQEREIDAMYQRLKDCPVGTTPVYGNQPIFTCPNNLGNGCGCNGYNQFI